MLSLMHDRPNDHTDSFTSSDPQAEHAHRTYKALYRLQGRHASTPVARGRQAATHVITPQEAVRLIAMIASGSIPVEEGEPDVDNDDLIAALTLIPIVRAETDELEISLLRAARGRGVSWAQIAHGLGLRSAQAAQQRTERLSRRTGDDE